jgi:hypothetical protein
VEKNAVKYMHSTSITKCKHNEKITTKTKGLESKKKSKKEKKQKNNFHLILGLRN